jgi:hypothetical protein
MSAHESRGIAHCRQCGKIIALEAKGGLCGECRGEYAAVPPEPSGFVPHEVRKAAHEAPALGAYLGTGTLCEECGRRPPLRDGTLCLQCRIEALHELREAAEETFERILDVEEDGYFEEEPPRTVAQVLEEKRARTATSRINPVGPQQIKNYRFI